MIEEEIEEILKEQDDVGERLNELADRFRQGLDTSGLLRVLKVGESSQVSAALWILGELPFERYNQEEFRRLLRELLGHCEPGIRLTAFSALYPAFELDRELGDSIIRSLAEDPNEGVRAAVKAAANRLSLAEEPDKQV